MVAGGKFAPSILIRFVGVRPELLRTAPPETRGRVMNIVNTIEPLSLRFNGIIVDSNAILHALPLSTINAPTLVISARDDLFNTFPAAQYLASKIPRAELIAYEDGGHLLIGHEQDVQVRIRKFISIVTAGAHTHKP